MGLTPLVLVSPTQMLTISSFLFCWASARSRATALRFVTEHAAMLADCAMQQVGVPQTAVQSTCGCGRLAEGRQRDQG